MILILLLQLLMVVNKFITTNHDYRLLILVLLFGQININKCIMNQTDLNLLIII